MAAPAVLPNGRSWHTATILIWLIFPSAIGVKRAYGGALLYRGFERGDCFGVVEGGAVHFGGDGYVVRDQGWVQELVLSRADPQMRPYSSLALRRNTSFLLPAFVSGPAIRRHCRFHGATYPLAYAAG